MKMLSFSRLYITLMIVLSILGFVLAQLSYQKSLRQNLPHLFLLQRKFDGINDRIIKVDAFLDNLDVIYEAPLIQTYSVQNNWLVVAQGEKRANSDIKIINMTTHEASLVSSGESLVTEISGGGGKFAIATEKIVNGYPDFNGVLSILDPSTKSVSKPDASNYAVKVSNLHLNNDGTALFFSGFGSYHYVMDMNDFNNVTQIKNQINYSTGFDYTGRKVLVGNFDSKDIKLVDVVDSSEDTFSLPADNFKDVVAKRASKGLLYTIKQGSNTDYTNQKYKLGSTESGDMVTSTNFSYEVPKPDISDRFITIEKYSQEEIDAKGDFRISLLRVRPVNATIVIFDTKTNNVIDKNLNAVDAVWEK